MKIFNKINGDFIKRGIILLGVIIGINVVYIGGNIYKNDGGEIKDNKYRLNVKNGGYKNPLTRLVALFS